MPLAHFLRLIAVGLLGYACAPASAGWFNYYPSGPVAPHPGMSIQAKCDANYAASSATYKQTWSQNGYTGGLMPTSTPATPSKATSSATCQVINSTGGTNTNGSATAEWWWCLASDVPTYGAAGTNPTCGAPPPPPPDPSTTCPLIASGLNLLETSVQSGSGVGTLTTCYSSCTLSSNFGGTGANNSWHLFPPFTATGTSCTPGPDQNNAEPVIPPIACAKPKCPGTVNGVSVCVLCEATVADGGSTTVDAPAGGASAPAGTTPGTTTITTTCTGAGSCTTTTTTKDADGNTIREDKKEQPRDDFCAENPRSPSCEGNKNSFSGACGSFRCEGDAVQCAMARDQHETNCKLRETPDGVAATISGLTGEGVSTPAFLENLPLSLPTGPANTCGIADFSVNIMGATWEVPLGERICPNMAVIRGVITAFGMLAFVLIVFRG